MSANIQTAHFWFPSGAFTLLGHLTCAPSARMGVVIVPPFGWEDVCSYRPLRELAHRLAQAGFAVLRYDLPGTGDSTGSEFESGLMDAWINSVEDAARELRTRTGLKAVAVVGIRLGATLALAAAARGAKVGDLVLWGGAARGRALLRELRAFRNMELPEYAETAPEATNDGSVEVGGFVLSAGTVAELEALDLTSLPPLPQRVLTLTRDEFQTDKNLLAALNAAGAGVTDQPGEGYAALMALPHEVRLDADTADRITEWLLASPHVETPRSVAPFHESAAQPPEQIFTIPHGEGQNFGILHGGAHAGAGDLWVLWLNPGAARHIGPNRMWVQLARELGAQGIRSLRLDLAGIGESDGSQNLDVEGLYDDSLTAQVEAAMAQLSAQFGARRFVLAGLCSGAFWAFHAAAKNPGVERAILVNPRLFFWDPEVDRRRESARNLHAVAKPEAWKRLVSGQVSAGRLKNAVRDVWHNLASESGEATQIPAARMRAALDCIEAAQTGLTLIFTQGEPLLQEMEQEGFLEPGHWFELIRVAGAGHTFRPAKSQEVLRQIFREQIQRAGKGPVV